MALKRCDNGHYFDPAKYAGCPSCDASASALLGLAASPPGALAGGPPTGGDGHDDGRTRRRDEAPAAAGRAGGAPATSAPAGAADSGRTERLIRRQTGIDPVVGWLVCTDGPDRGADYRLHSERNFVGRGENSDVRIAGDKTVSRENHLSISFDPKKDSFRLLPGDSRGLVYLNGEELVSPVPLAAADRIELGETTLLFVPLCGSGFRWDAPGRGDAQAD